MKVLYDKEMVCAERGGDKGGVVILYAAEREYSLPAFVTIASKECRLYLETEKAKHSRLRYSFCCNAVQPIGTDWCSVFSPRFERRREEAPGVTDPVLQIRIEQHPDGKKTCWQTEAGRMETELLKGRGRWGSGVQRSWAWVDAICK